MKSNPKLILILPKEKNRPTVEHSPNLVTLLTSIKGKPVSKVAVKKSLKIEYAVAAPNIIVLNFEPGL
jgi:hypothetical protein